MRVLDRWDTTNVTAKYICNNAYDDGLKSVATITIPISTNPRGGIVDPEFELSKKYPTVGHLTKPINLTITVIAPNTITDKFKDF